MQVVSRSPIQVGSLLWEPRPGLFVLTIVCRATFSLRPSESPLAAEQEGINEKECSWGDDVSYSVYAPCDMVPMKTHADVVLVGHAFAPGGQPVRSLVARLIVGDVDKSIEVVCDRTFLMDGSLQEGPRFVRMPLMYELAAGGPGTVNPVGICGDIKDSHGKLKVPNLQRPGQLVATPHDLIEPVGFGPIASGWPQRLDKLGRHAGSWSLTDVGKSPVPQDIDPAVFSCAPVDQQTATLREDERLVLENLHPDHPRLVTSLSGARPCAMVESLGVAPYAVPLRADTLWIETDRAICSLTWRGQVRLQHANQPGRVTVTMERRSTPTTSEERSSINAPTSTMILGLHDSRTAEPALPFARSALDVNRNEPRPVQTSMGLPFFGAAPATPPLRPDLSVSETAPIQPITGRAPGVHDNPPPAPIRHPGPRVGEPSYVQPQAPSDSPWASGASRFGQPHATVEPVPPTPAVALFAADAGSALAASNAAATSTPARRARDSSPPPAPAPRPAEIREVVQLVWFDPERMPRIRRKSAWRRLLDELEQRSPDPDEPAIANEQAEVEEQREIFEILTRGEPLGADGLHEALAAGVRDDGRFVPSLALLVGELGFPFDEVETLKAIMTTAAPLASSDERLKGAVEAAKDFFKLPAMLSPPGVADGLAARIREAFEQGKRVVPAGYLEAQTERILLDQRRYQRRSVFGEPHLRALLQVSGASTPIPVYLPEGLAHKLPLFQRFKARVIAEVHLAVDQYESHSTSLKVAALARLAPAPRR